MDDRRDGMRADRIHLQIQGLVDQMTLMATDCYNVKKNVDDYNVKKNVDGILKRIHAAKDELENVCNRMTFNKMKHGRFGDEEGTELYLENMRNGRFVGPEPGHKPVIQFGEFLMNNEWESIMEKLAKFLGESNVINSVYGVETAKCYGLAGCLYELLHFDEYAEFLESYKLDNLGGFDLDEHWWRSNGAWKLGEGSRKELLLRGDHYIAIDFNAKPSNWKKLNYQVIFDEEDQFDFDYEIDGNEPALLSVVRLHMNPQDYCCHFLIGIQPQQI